MKKLLLLPAFLLLFTGFIFSSESVESETDSSSSEKGFLDLAFSIDNHINDTVGYYNQGDFILDFTLPYFQLNADLAVANDGKYGADPAALPEGDVGGYYSMMRSGYLSFWFNDFSFTAGQKEHSDIFDSDYALFVNGNKNPAFIADFSYDGKLFFYETRWIRLNENSAIYDVDRGANLKVYGLKIGDFRIGLQESAVYVDRSFDAEYFISPIPQYFIQYTKISDGRPWETTSNENYIMGFFADYNYADMYYFGQWLIDDFNLHWLNEDNPWQPHKMAWAGGGRINTDYGKFSFDAALALKYVFESTYTTSSDYNVYPYQYTYYPLDTYTVDGETRAIDYTDNYLGFKYGENCAAVQAEYSNTWNFFQNIPIDYLAGLEYVISGSKSPSNPWHEDSWHDNTGSKFLDEDVLEHTIKSVFEAKAELFNFTLSLGCTLGYVMNELALEDVVSGEAGIWKPQEGENRFIYDISLGIMYTLKL